MHTENIAKLYLNTVGKVYFQVIFICLALRRCVSLYVVGFFFFFFNLHKSVFITIAEFLPILECARQGCKSLIWHDCSASRLLLRLIWQIKRVQCLPVQLLFTRMLTKWQNPSLWGRPDSLIRRESSVFLQLLYAACVYQSVCAATVTPFVLNGAKLRECYHNVPNWCAVSDAESWHLSPAAIYAKY